MSTPTSTNNPKTNKSGPTLRQRMRPTTKWKLTEPMVVDKLVLSTQYDAKGYAYTEAKYIPDYSIPEGNEFEVTGKFLTARERDWCNASGGPKLYLPIKCNNKDLIVRFNAIKDPQQK